MSKLKIPCGCGWWWWWWTEILQRSKNDWGFFQEVWSISQLSDLAIWEMLWQCSQHSPFIISERKFRWNWIPQVKEIQMFVRSWGLLWQLIQVALGEPMQRVCLLTVQASISWETLYKYLGFTDPCLRVPTERGYKTNKNKI